MRMITLTRDAQNDPIATAIGALASRDEDQAREINGVGFNQADSAFGHKLAETPVHDWSAANRRAAWEMLAKYARQLEIYGIDYTALPEPPKHDAGDTGEHARKVQKFVIDYDGGLFLMSSPYNKRLVDAQREIPGRRWNGTQNTFPPEAAGHLKRLLAQFKYLKWTVTDSARDVLDGKVTGTADMSATDEGAPVVAPVTDEYKVRVLWSGELHKRVGLRFNYDKQMVDAVKRIKGRRWDNDAKVWTVPLNGETAYKLVTFLSKNKPVWCEDGVREAIWNLGKDQIEKDQLRKAMAKLSSAQDAELEVEGLGGELKPFQRAGVKYVLEADKRSFIADDMGTGKTPMGLACAQATGSFPLIVVCPAVVKLSWRDHVQGPAIGAPDGWLPGKRAIVLDGTKPDAAKLGFADLFEPDHEQDDMVVILNYDILPAWLDLLMALDPKGLIIDESHFIKTQSAARTQAVLQLAEQVRQANGMVVNLTGTAVPNRPAELAMQLEALGRLDEFDGKAGLQRRRALEKLNKELRGVCFIRRLKKDVMSELPEKQFAKVPVTLSNMQEYKQVERDLITWLQEQVEKDAEFTASLAGLPEEEREEQIAARKASKIDAAIRAETLVKINALRKVCGLGKIKAVRGWIQNFLGSTDEKLIVFAEHIEVQRKILDAFPDAAHILGADNAQARDENVKRFQEEPSCKLIVCSLQAAGVGITLTAASNVAFVELGWTPATHDQAEDRAHRMGQEGNVTCWYLDAAATIDDEMDALIQKKREVTTATTDGVKAEREVSIFNDLRDILIAKSVKAA